MKLKVLFFALLAMAGFYAAFACSYSECGGGTAVCCKDAFGATYYKAAPPKPPKT